MSADKRLARLIDANTPQLNPVLANGLAVKQLEHVVRSYSDLWESASASFVPGLKFLGIRDCTPMEVVARKTASRKNSRRVWETSESHVFMVATQLEYQGERLPEYYQWMPAPRDGGYIDLRSSRFALSPILNDIVFSAANEYTIFVRLPRTRINFERLQHGFAHNAESGTDQLLERHIVQVVHGKIHQSKDKPHVAAPTTAIHYLFGRYGALETFERFLGFRPEIGYDDTITTQTHPADKWVICGSGGQRPRLTPRTWQAPRIRMAIPREHWSATTQNLVGGFFYVADHFPDRVNVQWLRYKHPQRIWRILLGLMIYEANRSEEIIDDKIIEHYKSLNHYIDTQAKAKLDSIQMQYINDFYDLLWYIVQNFDQKLREFASTLNSMYDKELNVTDFVMQDLYNAVFLSVFNLTQRLNTKGALTIKDVIGIFDRYLRPDLIFRINKPAHGEVTTKSIPNDNKAYSLTRALVPQSANDSRRKTKLDLGNSAIRLHPSIAEVGCYSSPSKSHPDGRRGLNLNVKINEHYMVQRDERFRTMLDEVEQLTQQR